MSVRLTELQIRVLFGAEFLPAIRHKTVIDFGCGTGELAVEMAIAEARRVIGLDIQSGRLEKALDLAARHGVTEQCSFNKVAHEFADIIVSKDAFEHFHDPGEVLLAMSRLLMPDDRIPASFGPTWLHPYGGHLFSIFPWAHLALDERCLMRWRSDSKSDGATRSEEVERGLNRMTISGFQRRVERSPLRLEWLSTVPIRGIRIFKNRAFREFGSSLVRCELSLREAN